MAVFDVMEREEKQNEVVWDQRSLGLQATTAAFTATNRSPATFKLVNKSRPLDAKHSDIHDLPENLLPEPPNFKKRKKISSPLIQSRFLSGVACAEIWDGDADSYPGVSPPIDNIINSNATQMSTPPHSTKRRTRGTISKQSERLPQYAVIKPSESRTKWTTTEDFVKATMNNYFTETTLEKLAAFRYPESQKKAQDVLTKGTVNLPPLKKPPDSLFDQEIEAITHALVDPTEPPTSYQPLGWSFNEPVDVLLDNFCNRTSAIEQNFIQSSSPPHVLDSGHIAPNPGLNEDEIQHVLYPTADLDANPENLEIQNEETVCGVNIHPISNKSERLLESTSSCEDSQNYGQYPSLLGKENSQNNVEMIMDYVETSRRTQRSELVPRAPEPIEEEFPFDEEDEAELAQLQVQLINAHNITHSLPLSGETTRCDDLLEDYMGLPEHPTPFSKEFPVVFQPLADAHSLPIVNHEYELQRTENLDDGLVLQGQEEVICYPRPWDLQVVNSNEYAPLAPFARPDFPLRVRDRSPIPGVSANLILKTCFRIGEAVRVSVNCDKAGLDCIIELFARVTKSSRESGTTRQHFEFADLFHNRSPYPKGIFENYKIFALQETESGRLLGSKPSGQMARCLGRLKRDVRYNEWMLHIVNIRPTDWEEIRWTKGIAGAGMVRSEGLTLVPKV